MGLSHAEVAHAWAHAPTRDTVLRHASGHALFFDRDTIYSYGRHFPIARIVYEDGRLPFVLFTTRKAPSHSTAMHMSLARDAIPLGWPVGHAPDVTKRVPDQSEAIRVWYLEEIADLAGKAKRARSRARRYLTEAADLREEGNSLAARFRLGWRLNDIDGAGGELEEIRERERERAERAAEVQRKKLRAKVADWRRGRLPATLRHPDVLLRVRGERVETSGGASFPIIDAKRAWPVIRRAHDEGKGKVLGERLALGIYAVDRIDAEGNVTAGCHHVKWAEIERLAKQLGLEGAS